ncbi:DUF1853 family protein [Saccharospirillum salsuginis]|uniref:DUF1853 family protein n=1 Tax=Saccharospirillum salsuginis TaxID=418750 RepID=UPI00167A65FB|nr:DUF1853 family protein [Saccharospirillum salsuginis]
MERIRRDLDWLMTAPSLLSSPTLRWHPGQACTPALPERIPAERLDTLIALRHGRLGAYFEALATALLEHSPDFTLLARNRVIHGDGRTLGELDLLLRDHRANRILHLELALKFYLKLEPEETDPEPDHLWIGPGQRDFLAIKHDRMLDHQLRLPDLARRHNAWPADLPRPDRSEAWVTGRLFHRERAAFKTPIVAADASIGHWLTLSEFNAREFDGHWISKADWLSPELDRTPAPIKHPLPGQFLGAPAGDDRPRHWFIVPDDWPVSARNRMLARFQPSVEIQPGD